MTELEERSRELTIWLTSRSIALTLYGFLGLQVGLATMLTGTGPLLESQFGPAVRMMIGALAFVGGFLVFAGSIRGDRSRGGWVAALAGSITLAGWAAFGFIASVSVTISAGVDFALPWQGVDPDAARLATPALYESLFLLIMLHVITIIRLGRPKRLRDRT